MNWLSKNKTEEILDEIKQRGIAFDDLSAIEKARMLLFPKRWLDITLREKLLKSP